MTKTRRVKAFVTYTVGGKLEMDVPIGINNRVLAHYIQSLMEDLMHGSQLEKVNHSLRI